jgi:hypothetical protein
MAITQINPGDPFSVWRDKYNANISDLGDLTLLSTSVSTDLVSAINEVDGDVGDLSTLVTTEQGSVVGSINEFHEDTFGVAGSLADLTTTDKTSIVDAINELDLELGDISSITTTATDVAGAIDELDAELGAVSGLDANNTGFTDVAAAIGTTLMTTTATDIVGAINELDSDIGDLTSLETASSASLVAALNEIVPVVGLAEFTIGSEAADVINVVVQLKKQDGTTDIAKRASVFVYLSDDANGDSVTATAPDGGWAIGTDGLLIDLVAGKCGLVSSESDGDIDIDISETGTPTFYMVLVYPNGDRVVSGAITFA